MGLEEVVERASRRYRTTQGMVAGGLRDDIAEQFGVSRMPVREALRQLGGEGMVSFYPHRGAVVSYRTAVDAPGGFVPYHGRMDFLDDGPVAGRGCVLYAKESNPVRIL